MTHQTAPPRRAGRARKPKLTDAQKAEIRARHKPCPSIRQLAREYGVSPTLIHYVLTHPQREVS